MTPSRKLAAAAGVLIFTATASYLVGSQLIASALSPDDLGNLDGDLIRVGVLLEFVNCVAVVGVGLLLFPILRRHNEAMALGYVGTRIIESVLLLVSALSPLLLLALSQRYAQAGATGASQLPPLGTLMTEWYDLAFQLAMLALGAGSLLLCYVLYRFALVPRALAVLGFVGYLALFASGWLEIFGQGVGMVLFAPGAVFEIIFPLWLIVRGLGEPAVTVSA